VRRATNRFALAGVAANALWVVLLLVGCTASTTTAGQTTTSKASPTPSEAPVSLTGLLTAPVPSLCGLPAGTLAGGALPGVSVGQGRVSLGGTIVRDVGTGATSVMAAVGSYAGKPVIAAAVNCATDSSDGVDQVVLWDKSFKVLGSFEVNAIATSSTGSSIHSISAAVDGGFDVRWRAVNSDEERCCGMKSAEVNLQWDGRSIVAGSPTIYDGSQVIVKMVEAVYADRPVGADIAEPDAVAALKNLRAGGATLDIPSLRCKIMWAYIEDSDGNRLPPPNVGFAPGTHGRYCVIPSAAPALLPGQDPLEIPTSSLYGAIFFVNYLGWNHYRITEAGRAPLDGV